MDLLRRAGPRTNQRGGKAGHEHTPAFGRVVERAAEIAVKARAVVFGGSQNVDLLSIGLVLDAGGQEPGGGGASADWLRAIHPSIRFWSFSAIFETNRIRQLDDEPCFPAFGCGFCGGVVITERNDARSAKSRISAARADSIYPVQLRSATEECRG